MDVHLQPMPEVPGVQHIYVNAAGLRMHVATAGPENGDPVMLLHGWPQHWWIWRDAIPKLAAAGYRVYAPDLRGFGWTEATDNIADYEKANLARDAYALLDVLEIDRPIRLAGHDWGGWAGFLLSMNHPERVDRYFACNITPPWGDPGPPNIGDMLKTLVKLRYQLPLSTPGLTKWVQAGGGKKLLVGGVVDGTTNRDVWKNGVLDTFLDQFQDPKRARATMYLYRYFITREVPKIAARTYVKGQRLTVPTRLLFGMNDVAINPAVIKADHSKMADDLTVELVDDCGHFIVDEQPELVSDRMLEWFAA